MIYPGVQIKAVEGNTLCANPDFNEARSDLGVEAIPVHSQIEGRVPQPDQPWCDGAMASRDFTHVCPKCRARTRVENIIPGVSMRMVTLLIIAAVCSLKNVESRPPERGFPT